MGGPGGGHFDDVVDHPKDHPYNFMRGFERQALV